MIIKTILITIILVGIIMLALGVKLLFNKDAEFTAHSCALDDNKCQHGRIGYKGDGVIIISPGEEVYKVRTDEKGISSI